MMCSGVCNGAPQSHTGDAEIPYLCMSAANRVKMFELKKFELKNFSDISKCVTHFFNSNISNSNFSGNSNFF